MKLLCAVLLLSSFSAAAIAGDCELHCYNQEKDARSRCGLDPSCIAVVSKVANACAQACGKQACAPAYKRPCHDVCDGDWGNFCVFGAVCNANSHLCETAKM